MARRQFDTHIKSLLHFDYPYYAEAGDGLGDEIGLFTWERKGGAVLCGSQAPADQIIADTPKFGYRCLHTASSADYILGTAKSAVSLSDRIEATFWIKNGGSAAETVITCYNSSSAKVFQLTKDADNHFVLNSDLTGGKTAGAFSLTSGWHFVRAQITFSSCLLRIEVDGKEWMNAPSERGSEPGIRAVSKIELGKFNGYIDEFCLRDDFTSGTPSHPENAVLSIQDLGGFGTGELGNVIATAGGVISAVASLNISSATRGTVTNIRSSSYGTFKAGSEVMLLANSTGDYIFTKIEKMAGSYYYFTSTVSGLSRGDNGVQMILVPNFNTFKVNWGVTLTCHEWNASHKTGGVAAFRVKGDCEIDGSIITHGKGRTRTDLEQMTHSKLIDKFIVGKGGGIFIACGGTFSAAPAARIGASWGGNYGPGLPETVKLNGGCGGAGYGGAGASDDDASHKPGGKGGVGGGGGGYDSTGYNASSPQAGGDAGTSGTGGWGYYAGRKRRGEGGTQGKTPGGNAPDAWAEDVSTGGGGAGGQSGSNLFANRAVRGAYPGANVILLAKKLSVAEACISTGGEGGSYGSGIDMGGAGTGFCYIAAEQFL